MAMAMLLSAVALLVLVCSLRAFSSIPALQNNRNVLSGCTALLSVLGMWLTFQPAGGTQPSAGSSGLEGPLSFILIPYAALGFALLFLLVLCGVGWFHRRVHRRNQRHERRDDRTPGRSSTPGRQARHRKVSGRESERG